MSGAVTLLAKTGARDSCQLPCVSKSDDWRGVEFGSVVTLILAICLFKIPPFLWSVGRSNRLTWKRCWKGGFASQMLDGLIGQNWWASTPCELFFDLHIFPTVDDFIHIAAILCFTHFLHLEGDNNIFNSLNYGDQELKKHLKNS